MGLIEKRLIKQGKEEWVPTAQKELREVTSGEQVYEVDWDTFANDEVALNNVQNQGLRRITAAFRIVCRDDLGKEAARDSVQKIVLKNVGEVSAKGVTIKDGIMSVHCAWGKGTDGYFTDREIQLAIEKQI
jgi:hypothetical protein